MIIFWLAAIIAFYVSKKFQWLIKIFIALQLSIERCPALFIDVTPNPCPGAIYMLIMVNHDINTSNYMNNS